MLASQPGGRARRDRVGAVRPPSQAIVKSFRCNPVERNEPPAGKFRRSRRIVAHGFIAARILSRFNFILRTPDAPPCRSGGADRRNPSASGANRVALLNNNWTWPMMTEPDELNDCARKAETPAEGHDAARRIGALARALRGGETLEAALGDSARLLRELIGFDRVAVIRGDADGAAGTILAASLNPDAPDQATGACASLSAPLVIDGAHWGRIVADHHAPRIIGSHVIALWEGCGFIIAQEIAAREATRARRAAETLADEFDHRLRNILALTRAVVRLGARTAASVEEFETDLLARLDGMAQAHAAARAEAGTGLDALAHAELDPFTSAEGPRAMIGGPAVGLTPRAATAVALTLHELATNAVKHGALGRQTGTVALSWEVAEPGGLRIAWRESGAPPASTQPGKGVGSALLARAIPEALGGEVAVRLGPDGAEADITLPARCLVAGAQTAPRDPDARRARPRQGARVLVVEDNAIVALDLQEMLRSLGAGAVTLAGSIDEAQAALEAATFDLALLDLDLDGESALPIAEALGARSIPFAFATGREAPGGAAGAPVLAKPFHERALAAIMTDLLG
jgi:two-component sensor histidine kinase